MSASLLLQRPSMPSSLSCYAFHAATEKAAYYVIDNATLRRAAIDIIDTLRHTAEDTYAMIACCCHCLKKAGWLSPPSLPLMLIDADDIRYLDISITNTSWIVFADSHIH